MKPIVRLPLVELGADAQKAVTRAMANVTEPLKVANDQPA
jgi:hypothetical protein